MADDCFTKITTNEDIKKLFGDRKIPEKVLKRFIEDVEAIKRAADEDPKFGSFQSRLNDYVRAKRELNKVSKEVKKNDLVIAKQLMVYARDEGFKGDVVEALLAKLSVPQGGGLFAGGKIGNGYRDSAEFRGFGIGHKLANHVVGRLDPGDLKILVSGQLDLEIGMEVRALGTNQGIGESKSEVAQRIAKVVHEGNRLLLREMILSGVPVKEMPEWVAPLTHNIQMIRAAGVDEWVTFVNSLPLDRKAMFGEHAGNKEKELAILRQLYKGVSLGKTGTKTAMTVEDTDDYGSNLTKKLTESRQLRFLNYKGEHDYNLKFGMANLSERIFTNYKRKGRTLGLIQVFGSNPERMLTTTLKRLEAQFVREGRHDLVQNIQNKKYRIEHALLQVTGESNIPGDNVMANYSDKIRTVQALSKLFWSGPRSLANLPVIAMQLKTLTGGNFFGHLTDVTMEFVKTIPPHLRAARQKELSLYLFDFLDGMNQEWGSVAGTGLGHKAMATMFKVNLMEAINVRSQMADSYLFQTAMADAVKRSWAEADDRVKGTILSLGLNEKDFDLLKEGIEVMPDGREMLTPQGLRKIPHDLVKKRLKTWKEDTGGRSISVEKYLNELENRYFGLINQNGSAATTSARARERSIITRDTYKGEVTGELLRFVGQFKSIWAVGYNLALHALNAAPDKAMLNRGKLASGKKDVMTVAEWAVTATAIAYVAQVLIDAVQGKEPPNPLNPETVFKSIARSGVGGMYADILFSDFESGKVYGAAETMLGPTVGQVFGAGMKLASQVGYDLTKDNPMSTQKGLGTNQQINMATRLIRNNIPFQQAPGMKQLLDYAQYDIIQESLVPGYKAKRALKQVLEDKKKRINLFGGDK